MRLNVLFISLKDKEKILLCKDVVEVFENMFKVVKKEGFDFIVVFGYCLYKC